MRLSYGLSLLLVLCVIQVIQHMLNIIITVRRHLMLFGFSLNIGIKIVPQILIISAHNLLSQQADYRLSILSLLLIDQVMRIINMQLLLLVLLDVMLLLLFGVLASATTSLIHYLARELLLLLLKPIRLAHVL